MPALGLNHYRVLGVPPDASTEEIERAFRVLARRWHPDANGGDGAAGERMKELNLARAALSDAGARAVYDETLRAAQRPTLVRAPQPAAPGSAAAPSKWSAAPLSTTGGLRKDPSEPLVSWMGTRETSAPTSSAEIQRSASVRRVLWMVLVGVAVVMLVILLSWLHDAVDSLR